MLTVDRTRSSLLVAASSSKLQRGLGWLVAARSIIGCITTISVQLKTSSQVSYKPRRRITKATKLRSPYPTPGPQRQHTTTPTTPGAPQTTKSAAPRSQSTSTAGRTSSYTTLRHGRSSTGHGTGRTVRRRAMGRVRRI